MPADEHRIDITPLFGYERLLRKPALIALEGDDTPTLRVGAIIRVAGDTKGYVPGGLAAGASAVIVGFLAPDFAPGGCTDHIVIVSDGESLAELKPSNIERVLRDAPRGLR